MPDGPPKVGDLIMCQVTKVVSYGAVVKYGDYTGAVIGTQMTMGQRIRVRVKDIDGRHFHGIRVT